MLLIFYSLSQAFKGGAIKMMENSILDEWSNHKIINLEKLILQIKQFIILMAQF